MNDELHNKVVKFFYDHEELFIAIMNKTPYQSDGWDYEIEVVKEFLTANQSCYCGDIYNLGVIHRDDGPCHYPNDKEPEPEPVACVYKATTKKGEMAHFGEYSAAKAWAGWGTVERVPLKTLTPISKSTNPCPTCESLARSVMLDQTSHDTTPPQRKPLTDEQIGDISKNYALSNPTTPLYFARAIEAAHGIKE